MFLLFGKSVNDLLNPKHLIGQDKSEVNIIKHLQL